MLAAGLAVPPSLATAATLGATLDSTDADAATDWSRKVVDSTIARYPSPNNIGGWGYQVALYLYGQYLVYKRTNHSAYLTYIKQWADRFVDSSGHISNSFNSLDSMMPGNVLVALYNETHDSRYKTACAQIHSRLATYPRTSDGGFWHADTSSRANQLWCDGTYMLLPLLVRYGRMVGDSTTYDEACKQLIIYDKHLHAGNGLWYHAYDATATQSWVVPGTHHSGYEWGRAIGWFMMAIIEVLENIPTTHPERSTLISMLQARCTAVAKYPHHSSSTSYRWYQVVNMGSTKGNWLETSSSSMYTYAISRGVQRGYLASSLNSTAIDGHNGVLSQLTLDSSGKTNLANICIGTNVGDLQYYLDRPRATNDFHGLGSFIIMNEQLTVGG